MADPIPQNPNVSGPAGSARRVVDLFLGGVGNGGTSVQVIVTGPVGTTAKFDANISIPGPHGTVSTVSTAFALDLDPLLDEIDTLLGDPDEGEALVKDYVQKGGE